MARSGFAGILSLLLFLTSFWPDSQSGLKVAKRWWGMSSLIRTNRGRCGISSPCLPSCRQSGRLPSLRLPEVDYIHCSPRH